MADGTYSMVVPAGTDYRVIRAVGVGMAMSNGSSSATIKTYEFGIKYDDTSPVSVKESTKEAITGLVSVVFMPGYGVVAGAVHDCDDKEVGGARVQVTTMGYDSTAQDLLFYFVNVSGSTLPTRKQKWTGEGGAFASLNVPAPGTAQITANGIIGSGNLQMIGQAQIPIIADAITIVHMVPLSH
jgi:hypothetical protein